MVVGDVTTAVDVLVIGAGPAGYVALRQRALSADAPGEPRRHGHFR